MSVIMYKLKRRVRHIRCLKTDFKYPPEEKKHCRSSNNFPDLPIKQDWTEETLVLMVAAQMQESALHNYHWRDFSIVMKCRVTVEKAVILGVVFHNGPGMLAVLALSRPLGLKVPPLHSVSNSNSWRSLSTAKVGGMLRQVAPAQFLDTFRKQTTSGAAGQRKPDS